jgi:hypothetical protein
MKRLFLFILIIPFLSFGQGQQVNYRAENRIIPPDSILRFPDIEAEYIGGIDSLRLFVVNNLRYPHFGSAQCSLGHVQGKVYIKMIVELDGSLSNIHVERGFEAQYDQAALECISKMPNWIPALSNGEVVRSVVRIPISFGYY